MKGLMVVSRAYSVVCTVDDANDALAARELCVYNL